MTVNEVFSNIAYWLLPKPPPALELENTIRDLAARHGGPIFAPHVTLLLDPGVSTAEAARRSTAAWLKDPLTLTVRGLQFRDEFTKCCFIQFDEDPAVRELADRLRNGDSGRSRYRFDPHLSLFYGHLDADQRESIAHELRLPRTITFSALTGVGMGEKIDTAADVEKWKELFTINGAA